VIPLKVPNKLAVFVYKGQNMALSILDGSPRSKDEVVIVIGHGIKDLVEAKPYSVIGIPKTYLPILRKVLLDLEEKKEK